MQSSCTSYVFASKSEWKVSLVMFLLLSLLMIMNNPVKAEMVNINKANAAALQQNLEGVGPVKADAIIQYRKKNGPFKSTSDLIQVPGIGSEIMNKNRRNLSTSRGLVKADKQKQQAKDRKESDKKSKNKNKNKNSKKDKFDDKKKKVKKKKDKKIKKGKSDKKIEEQKKKKKTKKLKANKKPKKDKKTKKKTKSKKQKKLKKAK